MRDYLKECSPGELTLMFIVVVVSVLSIAGCLNSIFDDKPKPDTDHQSFIKGCLSQHKVPNAGSNYSKDWSCR